MTQGTLYAMAILAGGGVLLLLLERWLQPRWSARGSLIVALGALSALRFLQGGPLEIAFFQWRPTTGWPVVFAYRFDTLAQTVALLAAVPALLLLLWMSLGAAAREGHFAPWILFQLALLLHLLGSTDLLLAYASWEVLLLATYFLLVHRRRRLPTPGIAEWFLGIQHLAGYPLLAGLLLIGRQNNTLLYPRLLPTTVGSTILLLLLGTLWVRMAQIPFQRWATAAAATPGPVSTMLLGGWGLLAGPYLWLRFLSRALPHVPRDVMLVAGSVTLLVGAVLTLRQERGRQIQAGDTFVRLGLLWIALGMDNPLGLAAALFLLLDFLLSKVVFHLALSEGERLERPVRQTLYAIGMWQALGLPPSLGFVGRWLLWLSLINGERTILLVPLLLATPLILAYLWRGWSLLPQRRGASNPLPVAGQQVAIVCALLLTLSGAAALPLWRRFGERTAISVLGAGAVEVSPTLGTLSPWLLSGTVVLLLIGGAGALWGGALRRPQPQPAEPRDGSIPALLQESLPVFPREVAWIAWLGWPLPLYRFLGQMIGRAASGFNQFVTFLERHITFFLLVVLVAIAVGLLLFMR